MIRRTYGAPNEDWVPHTLPGVVVDVRLPEVAWQTCARYEPGLKCVDRIFGDEGWVRSAGRSPNVTASIPELPLTKTSEFGNAGRFWR